jgi:hypothetical protein
MTTQRIPNFLVLGERQGTPKNKVIIHATGQKKVLFNGRLRDITENDMIGDLIYTVPTIAYYELKTR